MPKKKKLKIVHDSQYIKKWWGRTIIVVMGVALIFGTGIVSLYC